MLEPTRNRYPRCKGYKDDGLYQCTVANHVGYSVCVVEVKVSGGCRQWLLGWEGWTGGTWAVFWSLSIAGRFFTV